MGAIFEIRLATLSRQMLLSLIYLEGAGNYSTIHRIRGTSVLTPRTIKSWENELATFVRVHKKQLVNPQFVDVSNVPSRKNLQLRLTTGERFLVSRRRLKAIHEALGMVVN